MLSHMHESWTIDSACEACMSIFPVTCLDSFCGGQQMEFRPNLPHDIASCGAQLVPLSGDSVLTQLLWRSKLVTEISRKQRCVKLDAWAGTQLPSSLGEDSATKNVSCTQHARRCVAVNQDNSQSKLKWHASPALLLRSILFGT